MVVAARLAWARRLIQQGTLARLSVSAATKKGMGKLKITIHHKEAPTSQLVRTLLLDMLEAVILQADRLVCVDRGHRHATTNISEVSVWLSPIGAQEVEEKEKEQEKENDGTAEEPMAAAEITTADKVFHKREPGQADNEAAEQDDKESSEETLDIAEHSGAKSQADAPDEPAQGEPDAELAGGSDSSSSEAREDEGSSQQEHSDMEAEKEREESEIKEEEEEEDRNRNIALGGLEHALSKLDDAITSLQEELGYKRHLVQRLRNLCEDDTDEDEDLQKEIDVAESLTRGVEQLQTMQRMAMTEMRSFLEEGEG